MAAVNWMWIGNRDQFNATPGTPPTTAEADALVGLTAVGPQQIKPVSLTGNTSGGAFNTTYTIGGGTPSTLTYADPVTGATVSSQIAGFFTATYLLTAPDGTERTQNGVLIQMANGGTFFRPALQTVSEWDGIDSLFSVQIIAAAPVGSGFRAAAISFSADIFNLIIICFAAGTMILTAEGERPVEDLQAGDEVWTRDHGLQPLRWVGHSSFDAIDLRAQPSLRPICIEAGALGEHQPAAPLTVSRQHRVLVRSAIAQTMFGADEILVPVCHLTDLPGVAVDEDTQSVTYVHLLFDSHQVLSANGALAESLYPGQQAVRALGPKALSEVLQIIPDLLDRPDQQPAARALVRGQKVRHLVKRHVQEECALVS